jgi:hypothetical protein
VTKQVHRYWLANPRVAKPYHENAVGDEARLFPRDCREGVSARQLTWLRSLLVCLQWWKQQQLATSSMEVS